MKQLAEKIINGDIQSIAKLIRLIESDDSSAVDCLKNLNFHAGKSHIIGITGLPGSGKSTIIDKLIDFYKKQGVRVAVIAVDPSSPFSGGSILGDRIRMQSHAADKNVFIKSLPTRGYPGGLSKVASRLITVFDAANYDVILVETAGVGQTEVEIKNMVHTTVVVLVGGLGDYIQVIKAGIIEIADIFVINKAENNSDAAALKLDLEGLLAINGNRPDWKPPICLTDAVSALGINILTESIDSHRKFLYSTGKFNSYFISKAKKDFEHAVFDHINDLVREKIEDLSDYQNNLINDPRKAAEDIIKEIAGSNKEKER